MNILFLFLDGVGLGKNDPQHNPFLLANTPNLDTLLGGKHLTMDTSQIHTASSSLYGLDACLGVDGLPQSATGQGVILTGRNIPDVLGYHYGPKPNPPISSIIKENNLFLTLTRQGSSVSLINAYPPVYFENIHNGRRLFSAFPLAAASAGLTLKNLDDLLNGNALSADFTAEGWRTHLGFPDTPLLTLSQAGQQLARLASRSRLTFFEYWLTDVAGHRQNMSEAVQIIETIDTVLGSLLSNWNIQNGLILLTSDHGNLEDLSHRHHTRNPVPLLLIGSPEIRAKFPSPSSILDIYPLILNFLVN